MMLLLKKVKEHFIEFESEITKRFLEIDIDKEFGDNWIPSEKEITLVIHNIKWNPKKIKVNGKRKRISLEKNKLTIPVKWNPKKQLKVKITLE